MATVDARRLPIGQPTGSAVYWRALSREVWFRAGVFVSWEPNPHDEYWADHMPRARQRVHPL